MPLDPPCPPQALFVLDPDTDMEAFLALLKQVIKDLRTKYCESYEYGDIFTIGTEVGKLLGFADTCKLARGQEAGATSCWCGPFQVH